MGLRSDLQDLLDIQALTGQFKDTTGNLRQQAARQQLNLQAPGLIDQGNFGQVAGLAGDAGEQALQTGIIENLIKAKSAGVAKPGTAPLTREQIIANLPQELQTNESLISSITAAPLNAQLQLLKSQSTTSNQTKNRALGYANYGEKVGQNLAGQKGKAGDVISAAVKPFEEEDKGLNKADEYLKHGDNKAALAAAKTFIARSTGNTGVLTDRDVEQYLGRSLSQQEANLANYLNDTNLSGINPEQIKSLQEIVKITREVNARTRGQQVREALGQAINQNPKLIKNGKLDPSILDPLKREGFSFQGLDDNGSPILASVKKSTTIKQPGASLEGQGVDVAGLTSKINQIKDPTRKAQATAELQKLNGKSITQDKYNKFNSLVDQVLGAQ